ncbi:MAG: PAS domain-containing protein [Gammaproteobacteria bacterium]|nr:PAS domain-containing protein [Gammaproteobacteria bacterium]
MGAKPKNTLEQFDFSLHDLIELLPTNVYWFNSDNLLLGGNTSQAKTLGFSSSKDLYGKKLHEFYPKREADAIISNNNKIMRSGKPETIEENHILQNGKLQTYFSHKIPLKKDNKVIGLLGISTDITYQKQLENQLKQAKEEAEVLLQQKSELLAKMYSCVTGCAVDQDVDLDSCAQNICDYYENLLALMPGHVYWLDRDGVYLGCNDQQAKAVGFKDRAEIVGKRNKDIPWKHRSEDLDRVNQEVMETGISQVIEEAVTLKGNKNVTFLSSKVPLHNKQGKVIGLLGISIDITERKKMETELAQAKKEIEKSYWKQLNLLSVVDHESRTPLNIIIGLAQLLMSKKPSDFKSVDDGFDAFYEGLQNILSAGSDLSRIINYLFDFVEQQHIEGDKLPEDITEIRAITDWALDKNKDKIQSKSLRIDHEVEPDVPDIVYANSRRLIHVMDALVSNAVKYTDKGRITIKTSSESIDKDNLILTVKVSDTGCGIRSAQLKHIFDHFSEKPGKSHIDSGLILSATKQRLEMLDGKINIQSKPGKGTEICFSLPVHTAPKFPTVEEPEKPKILVVEDSEICSFILREFLTELKCLVDVAETGAETRRLINQHDGQYDIVFLDLQLPDTHGYDLLPFMQKNLRDGPNTPIIGVTANVTDEDKDKGIDAGMTDILLKPVYMDQIRGILDDYIYKKRSVE